MARILFVAAAAALALSTIFFVHMYIQFPVTLQLTAWYAAGFVIDLILVVALALYAFYISLAGQPLLRGGFLEES